MTDGENREAEFYQNHGYTYDPDRDPVAQDDRDPGNTDPAELTEALDPADDVYSLVDPAESGE